MNNKINHSFNPIFNEESRILILGSFPSVLSRKNNFYYGHPRNRFWKVLCGLTGAASVSSIEEKINLLLQNNIALWDVIQSCTITGSSDSSIKDVVPVELVPILGQTKIKRIFTNGTTAFQLYKKHCYPETGIEAIKLPSTSPANAAWSLEKLQEHWKQILI